MLTKRIIPCLDVKEGRVVKGVSFVSLRDAGEPVERPDRTAAARRGGPGLAGGPARRAQGARRDDQRRPAHLGDRCAAGVAAVPR